MIIRRICFGQRVQITKRIDVNLVKKTEPLDSIPEDAIEVDHYGKHKLENYYFHDDVFYRFNGRRYYPLNPLAIEGSDLVYVNTRDIYNKSCKIFYSKFKRDYAYYLEREDEDDEI